MQELTESGVIVVAHQRDQSGRQLQNLYWLQAPKLIPEEGQETLPTGEGDIVSRTPCHSVTPEGDKLAHNYLYKNPLIGNISTKRKRKSKTQIPDDFGISDGVRLWAEKNGHRRLNAHLDNFVDAAKAKDYRYVDWDAAFKTAIRKNWADIK